MNFTTVEKTKLQADYQRDGVVFIPQALDKETLELAQEIWQYSIDHPSPIASTLQSEGLERVKSLQSLQNGSDSGYTYQDIIMSGFTDIHKRLVRSRNIADILTALLAYKDQSLPDLRFFHAQVFQKDEEAEPTPWHQDTSDMYAEGRNLVAIWISFDKVDQQNALGIVKGSHLGPTYSSLYGAFRTEPPPDIDSNPGAYDIAAFACEPGDVVVFHPACLHGGGGTRSGQCRRTLALRFIGSDVCILNSKSSVNPKGKPYDIKRFIPIFEEKIGA